MEDQTIMVRRGSSTVVTDIVNGLQQTAKYVEAEPSPGNFTMSTGLTKKIASTTIKTTDGAVVPYKLTECIFVATGLVETAYKAPLAGAATIPAL